MSDIDRRRDFVTGLYPGPKWKKRVAKMSDAQVAGIYLGQQKKAAKGPKPPTLPKPPKKDETDDLPF